MSSGRPPPAFGPSRCSVGTGASSSLYSSRGKKTDNPISDRSFLGRPIPTSKRYSDISSVVQSVRLSPNSANQPSRKPHDPFDPVGRIRPRALALMIHEATLSGFDFTELEANISAATLSNSLLSSSSRSLAMLSSSTRDISSSTSVAEIMRQGNSTSGDLGMPSQQQQHIGDYLISSNGGLRCGSRGMASAGTTILTPFTTLRRAAPGAALASTKVYDDRLPILVLDVRSTEEYLAGHIVASLTYPAELLRRDFYPRDLIYFKNKPGKRIVLCDKDESAAVLAGRTLIGRGFDNIDVLAGGLDAFCTVIQGAIVGRYNPPPAMLPVLPRHMVRKAQASQALLKTGSFFPNSPSASFFGGISDCFNPQLLLQSLEAGATLSRQATSRYGINGTLSAPVSKGTTASQLQRSTSRYQR